MRPTTEHQSDLLMTNAPVHAGSAMLGVSTVSMIVSAVVQAGPFFQVLMYITAALASTASFVYYVKSILAKKKS